MEVIVTVYSKPACVQCNATYRALDSAGVSYVVVDVMVNTTAKPSPAMGKRARRG